MENYYGGKNDLLHQESLKESVSKKEVYDNWAESYEDYVNSINYLGPVNLVKELNDFISDLSMRKLKILDFGCGTGLVGLQLNKILSGRYFFDIDGIDISEKMIEKSREKNVYRQIWNLNLNNEVLPQQYQYDIIVSSGVFLEGHVGFGMIDKLLNSLKPFGHIFFTVRETFKNKNLNHYIQFVSQNPRLEILYDLNIEYLPDVDCRLVIAKKLF